MSYFVPLCKYTKWKTPRCGVRINVNEMIRKGEKCLLFDVCETNTQGTLETKRLVLSLKNARSISNQYFLSIDVRDARNQQRNSVLYIVRKRVNVSCLFSRVYTIRTGRLRLKALKAARFESYPFVTRLSDL